MKKYQVMYLRALIRARKWANTERGERVLCTIGAVWCVLAIISAGLLVTGLVLNELNVTL